MNIKLIHRMIAVPLAVALVAAGASAEAQEKAKAKRASTPKPAAAALPAPIAEPVIAPVPPMAPLVTPIVTPMAPIAPIQPMVWIDAPVADVSEVEATAEAVQREIAAQASSIEHQARIAAEIAGHRSSRVVERQVEESIQEALAEAEDARMEAEAEARERVREAMEEAREADQTQSEEAKERAREDAERKREREREARERAREREEQARERAQEARERAREKIEQDRERQREAREATREAARESERHQASTADELYEQAMQSIDEEDWSDALRPLNKLVSLNTRVDAALYWSGYSQWKLNRAAAALASLARLQKDFPTSRWEKEAKALEIEVRGKSGQTPRADQIDSDDDDLKLMAVSALAQSDPKEALPLLAKILKTPNSNRKVRERALFVLAQIGSDEAGNAIADVARGNSSPELQRKAIDYLGVFGGPGNRKVLSDIYGSTTDNALRRKILNSFMVAGDKARVLNAAKTEKDPALRSDAVRLLGVMGGTTELSQMYQSATSTQEKKDILQALFIGGAVEPVANAAKGEKDREVRLTAVRNLGLMGRRSQDFLSEMYRTESDPQIKKEVLNAFFLQGNSTKLVEIARAEKDPGLKKEAVHWLSLMNSKESRAFMMELLKD
jgi:hypothetical protein